MGGKLIMSKDNLLDAVIKYYIIFFLTKKKLLYWTYQNKFIQYTPKHEYLRSSLAIQRNTSNHLAMAISLTDGKRTSMSH